MKSVLITGVFGFLGRQCLKYYKSNGCYVAGIGRCDDKEHEGIKLLDKHKVGPVTFENLSSLDHRFDLVIHCAGSGSVGKSIADPHKDFCDTVETAQQLLEYMRLCQPEARLVLTSSAAVYGNKHSFPIKETESADAVSPYGIHKELVERLCWNYSKLYGIPVSVIRFFSLYGPELRKQLLWDTCNKIMEADEKEIVFFGTGDEVRDFIEVGDALRLIDAASEVDDPFVVINGGTGKETCVSEIVHLLADMLSPDAVIRFNQQTRIGDPKYLCADIAKAGRYGWSPEVTLAQGVRSYVAWYKTDRG